MYENETYENILKRMMENTPNALNKSEGTVTYDTNATQAIELNRAYFTMNDIINMFWIKNKSFEELDNKVEEQGLSRKEGTKTVLKVLLSGAVGTSISNGTIFEYGNLRYIMLNDVVIGEEDNISVIEALEIGSEYNLLPNISLNTSVIINGLESATVTEVQVEGTNTEDDESLINRYYDFVRKTRTSGNLNDYEAWAMEVTGVGDVKGFDADALGQKGKVKLVIINSEHKPASTQLVDNVRAYVMSKKPIGATPIIESAIEKTININVDVVPANGYTIDQIKLDIEEVITKYLYDNAFKSTYISVARIGNMILDTDGVFDYSNFTVNGSSANIALEDNEVPVLGEVVVG